MRNLIARVLIVFADGMLTLLLWLVLTAALAKAFIAVTGHYTAERYPPGQTPHRFFTVAVYAANGQTPEQKLFSKLTPQDKLWQQPGEHYFDEGMSVTQIAPDRYRFTTEFGMVPVQMDYRVSQNRAILLALDEQTYVLQCGLAAVLLAILITHLLKRRLITALRRRAVPETANPPFERT